MKFHKKEELKYLKGDSSKTREVLGWKPEYTFESMLQEIKVTVHKPNTILKDKTEGISVSYREEFK